MARSLWDFSPREYLLRFFNRSPIQRLQRTRGPAVLLFVSVYLRLRKVDRFFQHKPGHALVALRSGQRSRKHVKAAVRGQQTCGIDLNVRKLALLALRRQVSPKSRDQL